MRDEEGRRGQERGRRAVNGGRPTAVQLNVKERGGGAVFRVAHLFCFVKRSFGRGVFHFGGRLSLRGRIPTCGRNPTEAISQFGDKDSMDSQLPPGPR